MVADRASSVRGRARALELRPSTDREAVEREIERVRQISDLWTAGYDTGAIDAGDLTPLLARLRHGEEPMEPLELLDLGRFLEVSTRARRTLDREEVAARFPDMHALGLRFGDFGAWLRRLGEVLDPSGEFLDSASPTLGRLRRQLRLSRAEAGEALAELARRESSHPEESFVTLREGRYVLAVRAQDRSRLPGIVHGHSGSGQTIFLEPLQVLERNNGIAEMEARELQERVAILRELTQAVRARREEIAESDEAAADLDLLRARAALGRDLDGRMPVWNDGERLRLVGARHPLLADAAGRGGSPVVPLDLEVSGEARTLILSGPNMGGKTVALKTAGLLVAMAQAALPIPAADGTDLPFVDGLFADLGDEQSIEQETSTFAGHLRNLGLAWQGATSRSLVLLDELGGGTDPDEGTALGRAALELLTERGCLLLATTHLIGLKMLAHEHPRMANAAMEFDPATQKPTYRLRPGAPGRSRAFELARRVLPADELLERAERYRNRLTAALDELLSDLEQKRGQLTEEIAAARRAAEQMRETTRRREELALRLKQRIHDLRQSRWETTGRWIAEAESLLREARRMRMDAERERAQAEKRRLEAERERGERDRSGRMATPAAASSTAAGEAASFEERLRAARARLRRPQDRSRPRIAPEQARAGVAAYSEDLGATVRIDSPPDPSGKVWVWHGSFRIQVPLASLTLPGSEEREGAAASDATRVAVRPRRDRIRGPEPESVGTVERQIDLRGRTAEESVAEVERYLDRAAIAGVPEVRIIHGKGKGILKREIEALLASSPVVESFRIGEPREGGWGATVVRVRSAQVGG